MSELPVPAEEERIELLRVWIVGENLQCAIQAGAFDDPGTWGAILAEMTRHVASTLQQQEGAPAEQTVQRILEVFHDEMRSPSTE